MINILSSHVEDNKEYIDDMEVLKTIDSNLEATRELGKCRNEKLVYHTSKENIYMEIRNIFGFRMVK